MARKLDLVSMMLRLGWILGILSTRRYSIHTRRKRFGPDATEAYDYGLSQLEDALFQDRLTVMLFLFTCIVLAYTFLNAPNFQPVRAFFGVRG